MKPTNFKNIKEHIENQLQSDMHTKYQRKRSTKSKKIIEFLYLQTKLIIMKLK